MKDGDEKVIVSRMGEQRDVLIVMRAECAKEKNNGGVGRP